MRDALTCRLCHAPLRRTFVDLGEMPVANDYPSEDELGTPDPTYPLHARVCEECLLVQLPAVVTPQELFEDYAYFSSYSESWVEHARRYADSAAHRLGLHSESLVIELASNDGYLLKHFQALGVGVLGIEPAANVAAVARAAGVPTETRFFGQDAAADLVDRGVRADLLVANNVLAHVPDLEDFVAGMATVLKPSGVVSIEVPHLLHLISDIQFDTIYHEHFSYFCLLTVERALGLAGLDVFDVEQLPTHGGSLRVWAAPAGAALPTSAGLASVRALERQASLDRLETYEGFTARVRTCVDEAIAFFAGARAEGRSVVAYGAAAKGTTLLNACRVTSDDVAFIVDRNPEKQGRFQPGTRLPIFDPERVRDARPDYLVILPWNLREEIAEQMRWIDEWGGRFVTLVPNVRVT